MLAFSNRTAPGRGSEVIEMANDYGKMIALAAALGGEGGGGGGSELPDVTAADNGKFLGVVNGKWDKTDPPSPGGETVPYDLQFTATTSELVDSHTTSTTVSNASLVALKSMNELLDKFDTYKQLSMGGGFSCAVEITPGISLTFVVTATITNVAIVPNEIAKAMIPGVSIGDEDVILIKISPVHNDNAYSGSWAVFENTSGIVQTMFVGN